jgi:hypothetical protein
MNGIAMLLVQGFQAIITITFFHVLNQDMKEEYINTHWLGASHMPNRVTGFPAKALLRCPRVERL